MEESEDTKEASPQFEIKLSSDTSMSELKERLRKGNSVQFIVTNVNDIWLTDKGHDGLRFSDGLTWNEITHRGYARAKNPGLSIQYYDTPPADTRYAIRSSLETFLGQ